MLSNIGTDLLMCLRSDWIEPVWMVGIEDSPGIQRARDLGLKTSTDGIDGLIAGWDERPVEFVFDATSAAAHADNSQKVVERGALMIDLTPAAIGPYCIPPVNLDAVLSDEGTRNVNMVTCGGQATIPMVRAVSRVQPVRYLRLLPPWPPVGGHGDAVISTNLPAPPQRLSPASVRLMKARPLSLLTLPSRL